MDLKHTRPMAHGDYTVAIICAIGFEMSAVRYLLDCEHPRLRAQPGDANMYILGELAGHNTVLACLPGNQGKSAAAVVATNLARTFTSIEWRVLVGIGGGVPSHKHDIRLGDVVVSMPEGQYGGVVQYDLGKDTEDDFRLKGFLVPPPSRLRSAVEMMKSDHLMAENKVDEFLSHMLQKSHRLSIYARPSPEQDILFEPAYAHPPDQASCGQCDRANAVPRKTRASGSPEIHYGLIASGDRVLKAAHKRDAAVNSVGDILCFEMEAAGIATEYSCIVLRGISDYGDSHKNDDWHYYAAAAAAASAKELLSYIDPEELAPSPLPPSNTAPVGGGQDTPHVDGQRIQNSGSGNISFGRDNVTVGRDMHIVNTIVSGSSDPTHLLIDFMSHLCESDPSADMVRIEDDKGGLLYNCFDWILENDQLKHWQQSKDARLLWIKGDAGKGKTMAMIGLAKQLACSRSLTSGFAFFFCQNADPRLNNATSVLRGLVWMLLRAHPSPAQYIPEEYRDKKDKRAAMFENSNQTLFSTLKIMLTSILRDARFDRLHILVDALDECSQDLDKLVDLIRQDTMSAHSRAKWLVSGRYTVRLNRELKPSQHRDLLSLELNESHVSEAVASFIRQRVDDLVAPHNRKLREQARDRIMAKAESTFLWAALVCKHLKGLAELQILEELDKFPPGLAPLYERMMQLIEERGPNLSTQCKQILRAVSITYRPLTLHELVPVADLRLPLDHLRELVDLCASFVTIRNDTIRFIHQSAKDYLDVLHTIFPRTREGEHQQVVTRCLKAMSNTLKRDVYGLDRPGFAGLDVVIPSPDPLLAVRYACTYWIRHLLETNAGLQDCNITNSVDTFLRTHFLHWLEGLSLLKQLPGAVVSLSKLDTWRAPLAPSPRRVAC
ncbi:ankyrin repeat domain-containing protein 50 [Microdochium nivale]|nr:ankyrin repeat domain-containing protein 50 [Microdochium nivale]